MPLVQSTGCGPASGPIGHTNRLMTSSALYINSIFLRVFIIVFPGTKLQDLKVALTFPPYLAVYIFMFDIGSIPRTVLASIATYTFKCCCLGENQLRYLNLRKTATLPRLNRRETGIQTYLDQCKPVFQVMFCLSFIFAALVGLLPQDVQHIVESARERRPISKPPTQANGPTTSRCFLYWYEVA